jgi:uncharacterized protein YjiK
MAHDDPSSREDNVKERRDDTGPEGSSSTERITEPVRDERGGIQKLNKRQKKMLRDQTRPLDSWERYRALTDVVDEQLELVDLADHKARFALIIMGALNAFLFIIGSNTDAFEAIPDRYRPIAAAFVGLYAAMAIYFFVQAIESLRPRKSQAHVGPIPGAARSQDAPMGLRFYDDMLSRDTTQYRQAWQDVTMSQLTGELAVQAHSLAAINRPKYVALSRLYSGLKLMTLVSAVMLILGAVFVLSGKEKQLRLGKSGSKKSLFGGAIGGGQRGSDVLGSPEPVGPHVKEPSGVAFDAKRGHAFVVGDSGQLVELDLSGQEVWRGKVKGDLEELAVHTPSGLAILLDETKGELIAWDPASRAERGRWMLDQAALLGQAPEKDNNGFEGLAFREESGKPGGGVFYLGHQRGPAMIVAVSFDPAKPGGTLGADAVLSRWTLTEVKTINALTWVQSLGSLLVLDGKGHAIDILKIDGSSEAHVSLHGPQPEGLTMDSTGALWVADDQKGLERFPGALDALQGYLREHGEAPDPDERK